MNLDKMKSASIIVKYTKILTWQRVKLLDHYIVGYVLKMIFFTSWFFVSHGKKAKVLQFLPINLYRVARIVKTDLPGTTPGLQKICYECFQNDSSHHTKPKYRY